MDRAWLLLLLCSCALFLLFNSAVLSASTEYIEAYVERDVNVCLMLIRTWSTCRCQRRYKTSLSISFLWTWCRRFCRRYDSLCPVECCCAFL